MARTNFTAAQRIKGTDELAEGNVITIGPAAADFRISRLIPSVIGGTAIVQLMIEGGLGSVFEITEGCTPIDLGTGDSSQFATAGVLVGRGKQCVISTQIDEDFPPPGGWATAMTAIGVVENAGDLEAVKSTIGYSGGGLGSLPGEDPRTGTVFG